MSIWDALKKRVEDAALDARHAVDGLQSAAHNLAAPRGLTADEVTRQQAWADALPHADLPVFVKARLGATARRELPWISTASAAEMLAQRSHGIEPLGTVTGNCWYHFGYSWSDGQYDGWHHAIDRLRLEATLLGANAVVDVQLHGQRGHEPTDMDYALSGTAVRIRGLPPSIEPALATVSALHFVRLLDDGAVPVGIAIGAHFDWYIAGSGSYGGTTGYGQRGSGSGFGGIGGMDGMGGGIGRVLGGSFVGGMPAGAMGVPWMNTELADLSAFQQHVRRSALEHLRSDGQRLQASVLAHTQYSELFRQEGDEQSPPRYLCRHIAIGTAIAYDRGTLPKASLSPTFSLADRALEAPPEQP